MLDPKLLEILACPLCKSPLVLARDATALICRADRLAFPVQDGVPVLLDTEARVLTSDDPLLR